MKWTVGKKVIPLAINNKHPDSIKLKGFLTEYAKYYMKMSKDYSFLKPIIISDIMR